MGEVHVHGMKNSALPILFATLLVKGSCVLENVPPVNDISLALEILRCMGASVEQLDRTTVRIDTSGSIPGTAPRELVANIRGSSYLMGAELGRCGKADISWPGGCNFGVRPMNLHFKGFEALGAEVQHIGDRIQVEAPNGLHGSNVYFDRASVGATANMILASVLAEGTTVIENAAREPHIVDLANFLNTCGANVIGAGTTVIKVHGVKELHGCSSYVMAPDMIEAGTFMVAAAATGGRVRIGSMIPKHVESISAKLTEMGATVEEGDDYVTVTGSANYRNINISTIPYPGFPTDMHPQFAPILCIANGVSTISEGIWENRFRYVEELRKMGANIVVGGDMATFIGGQKLIGASVTVPDLRAGAALVIAGLIASGKTEISEVSCIHRGYCDIVKKLQSLGADISEVTLPLI